MPSGWIGLITRAINSRRKPLKKAASFRVAGGLSWGPYVAGRCRFAGNVRSFYALRRSAILFCAVYSPDVAFFTQRTGMPERQSMSIMFTWLLFEKSRYW